MGEGDGDCPGDATTTGGLGHYFEGGSFKMRYAQRIVFSSFAVLCAAAACLFFAAVAAAQITPADRVFSGKLGEKYRIQMRLRREGKMLTGSYFYERVQQNVKLSGE